MDKKIKEFYKKTSQFTDLGKYKEEAVDLWENKCNRSLKELCHYIMNVTVHRVVLQLHMDGQEVKDYGDFSYLDYTTPMSEDDIFLTASSMFNEIYRRDKKGFYIGRPVEKRINVTCRYVSVLTSAILKANGIPCRCRALWANYLRKGKYLDHWVNEYWNEEESRWVMFDMDDLYDKDFQKYFLYEENKFADNYLDMSNEYYLSAAEMWLNYRNQTFCIKQLQYGESPAKLEAIVKYLFLDFFAIMNFEPNYKFIPFSFNKKLSDFTNKELEELDTLAKLMLDLNKNFNKLTGLFNNTPKYRMLESPLVDKSDFQKLIKLKGYKNL